MSGEDLQPGSLVADQYEIERLIGSGGFARVYRARQLELDRPVALKVLAPRSENDSGSSLETVKKRFYREARLISRLQAPHTVTVYEYDVLEDGKLYMALEYIDGTDLAALLSEQAPLAPDRITRILIQVLKALGAAHSQDILHRDIKSTNVMVFERFGETDCVKLLDFGIAKSVMAENQLEAGLTMEGAVIGTPRSMSPEQIQGRPLTPASDLFSAGLLLYEMYTGESPFETHDVNMIYKRMKRMPDDLGPLGDAPPPLAEVAKKLLTYEIGDRYDDAGEALADLRGRESTTAAESPDVLEEVGGVERPPESTDSPPAAADESDAISFPLGLDRAGATPSTELTSVSAGGQTTAALTPSSAPDSSTPEWRASMEGQARAPASESSVRRPSGSEPPRPDAAEPPNGDRPSGNQTAVTADANGEAPGRESQPNTAHTAPEIPDAASPDTAVAGRSWQVAALVLVIATGLAFGLWYALDSGGKETSPLDRDRGSAPVEDREPDETPPPENDFADLIDLEPVQNRAADRLGDAVDEARRLAESAAEDDEESTSDSENSADSDSTRRRRRPTGDPAGEQPTSSEASDEEGADPSDPSNMPDESGDDSAGSKDETSDDSQDPGFEVQPLE